MGSKVLPADDGTLAWNSAQRAENDACAVYKQTLPTGTFLGAHWLPKNRGELDILDDIVNALCAACLLTMIMRKESKAQKYCA